jgi:flagellar protein FlgJ
MSIKVQNTPTRAAFDMGATQDLREQLRKDPQAGLKAAAQQFETLFLQMVLKSMRDTVPSDGLLQSDQTRFYNSLLDQQMAQNMATSGNGVGFARLIEQQLGRQYAPTDDAASGDDLSAILAGKELPPATNLQYREVPSSLPTSAAYPAASAATATEATTSGKTTAASTPKEFANQVWPHAVEASRATGIPPQFLVAQSALESGWGKSEIRKADGTSSHNLFGIKAGAGWTGDSVAVTTTEYVDGKPQQVVENFRAYSSYAEAFRDYAGLLRNSPRYGGVIGTQDGTEFARRLQAAGYATDPKYAEKLASIINGPTLRQALIG